MRLTDSEVDSMIMHFFLQDRRERPELEVPLDEQLTMELEKTCPEWRGQLRAAVEARTLVSIVGSD